MSEQLNHTDLIKATAKRSGKTFDEVDAVLRAAFDVIGETVTGRGRVTVTNFGSWHADKSPRRVRRNPQTGEEWMAPATWYPRFTWSPKVRKATAVGMTLPTLKKRGSRPA